MHVYLPAVGTFLYWFPNKLCNLYISLVVNDFDFPVRKTNISYSKRMTYKWFIGI